MNKPFTIKMDTSNEKGKIHYEIEELISNTIDH